MVHGLLALGLVVVLVAVPVEPAAAGGPKPGSSKPSPGQIGPSEGTKVHTGSKATQGPSPGSKTGPPPPGLRGDEEPEEDEGGRQTEDGTAETAAPAPEPVAQPSQPVATTSRTATFRAGGVDLAGVDPPAPAEPAPEASAPAGPSLIERAIDVLPRSALPTLSAPVLPALPQRIPQPHEPTIPLLLVVALVAYALVVIRGDRRDPKLARSTVDRGARGVWFE